MEAQQSKTTTVSINRPKSPKRLSAGHLSDAVRNRIVALMQFHESAETAALAACREFPGLRITARLVLEVMVLCITRKPPLQEMSHMHLGMRRSA